MTFMLICLGLAGVGLAGGTVVLHHRRKMKRMQLDHELEVTRALDETIYRS